MKKDFIIHITSWENEKGETYKYDGVDVGIYSFHEKVDVVVTQFLKQEVNAGFYPVSCGLIKVTEESLNDFKREAFNCEIGNSMTYDLDKLCEVANRSLKGYDVSYRYKNSIHYCEEILSKLAICKEVYSHASKQLQVLDESYNEILMAIGTSDDQDSAIMQRKRICNLQERANSLLDESLIKMNSLKESKQSLIDSGAKDLELILRNEGYKTPVLNFKVPS